MKKSHLHNNKDTGFKTAEAYFDTFDELLFKKLNVQKEMTTLSDSGFTVPDNYFENFDSKVKTRIKSEHSPTVRTLLSWRNAAYISGIAASLVLMLTFYMKSDYNLSINQIETASIEDYLDSQNLNIYDIASLLNEDDLFMDDFVSNTLTEESLENYLLNNTSVEDLIIEK